MIFPVKVPYTISADIAKFAGAPYAAAPSEYYIEQKKRELSHLRQDILGLSTGIDPLWPQIREYFGDTSCLTGVAALEALALGLEEDIAILKDGILEGISFCFPSGFIPVRNLGLDFFDMHLPVADGDRLRASGPKVSALISKEGSMFRRFVWGITSLDTLSQHPDYIRKEPARIEDLFFRTETQTTVGLAGNVCLFFVKVEMTPLEQLWAELEKRRMLLDSVQSMSEAVLDYKNMRSIKNILIHNA